MRKLFGKIVTGAVFAAAATGGLSFVAHPAGAATCEETRVYIDGSETTILSCSGDICVGRDVTLSGPVLDPTGAGETVCAF